MRRIEAKDCREMDDKRTEAFLVNEKEGRLIRVGLPSFKRGLSASVSSPGFTFVEMVIIISIIGIIAGAAIFKGWGSTNPTALKVAVDQVITEMRFAQTMAMANSQTVYVSFTSGSRSFMLGNETRHLPGGVVAGVTRTFSFDMLGAYTDTADGFLTLSAGSSTKRVRIYTVTSFIEEN